MFFQLHGGPLIQTGGVLFSTIVLLLKVFQFSANRHALLFFALLVMQPFLQAVLHLSETLLDLIKKGIAAFLQRLHEIILNLFAEILQNLGNFIIPVAL